MGKNFCIFTKMSLHLSFKLLPILAGFLCCFSPKWCCFSLKQFFFPPKCGFLFNDAMKVLGQKYCQVFHLCLNFICPLFSDLWPRFILISHTILYSHLISPLHINACHNWCFTYKGFDCINSSCIAVCAWQHNEVIVSSYEATH